MATQSSYSGATLITRTGPAAEFYPDVAPSGDDGFDPAGGFGAFDLCDANTEGGAVEEESFFECVPFCVGGEGADGGTGSAFFHQDRGKPDIEGTSGESRSVKSS